LKSASLATRLRQNLARFWNRNRHFTKKMPRRPHFILWQKHERLGRILFQQNLSKTKWQSRESGVIVSYRSTSDAVWKATQVSISWQRVLASSQCEARKDEEARWQGKFAEWSAARSSILSCGTRKTLFLFAFPRSANRNHNRGVQRLAFCQFQVHALRNDTKGLLTTLRWRNNTCVTWRLIPPRLQPRKEPPEMTT